METLKTAAIVVLLMTVTYSAYVSLTTPPDALPSDIPELVFNDESRLAFDTGLPDSLDELGINSGTVSNAPDPTFDAAPAADARVAMANHQDGNRPGLDFSSGEEPALASPYPGDAAVSDLSWSDPPSNSSPDSSRGFAEGSSPAVPATELSSVDTMLNSADRGVSVQLSDGVKSNVPAPAEQASPRRRYPRTSTTFEMPDPNDFSADFPKSSNPTEVGGAEPKLALTSGSTDLSSNEDVPSYNEVTQTAGVESGDSTSSRNLGLANAIRTADSQYAGGQRKEALATLSIFYNTPNLSGEERAELLTRLDPLAREVIYSKRHLLEQPHRVGSSETLVEISERFEVPWQLLANINQIGDPVTVLPGTELKVVRGPFRAEVSLQQKELTLFLGDLYAGRFPIEIGNDPRPRPGTFTVQDKRTARTYYDASGSPVPAGSPDNPYGNVWIDLGGQLSIHGSPSTTEATRKGCISLASDYASDLYGILSQGSAVRIRR